LFSQLITRTGLKYVDLRNNQIGERGAIAIAYVSGTRNEEGEITFGDPHGKKDSFKIRLEGNPVGEAVLKFLS